MKEIPNIISDKDLLYLNDAFDWNFNLAKETYNYIELLENNDFKSVLETITNMHKQYSINIINILKGGIDE
ncbi:MAG TPA: hypothetical protein PLT65_05210 [Bacilli bacterium]|nr:hypothetical protein [Bacilli bacterium]